MTYVKQCQDCGSITPVVPHDDDQKCTNCRHAIGASVYIDARVALREIADILARAGEQAGKA